MGEGTGRVGRNGSSGKDPRQLAGDIETLRSELGDLVSELDRRRHEAFDVRLQLRRHPVAAGVAAATIAAALGGTIALIVWSRRRRQRPIEKAKRVRRAMGRLFEDPDRVAMEPRIGEKILAAAGTAAATMLTKRLVDRAVRPARAAAR